MQNSPFRASKINARAGVMFTREQNGPAETLQARLATPQKSGSPRKPEITMGRRDRQKDTLHEADENWRRPL
jgi:hypothetical protein